MSDYLWDKTGDADPEVARLEELLGELRYRPQKFELLLELPAADARRVRARRAILSWPALAAAAALVLMALAGLWLAVVRREAQRPSQIVNAPPTSQPVAPPEKVEAPALASASKAVDESAGRAPKGRAVDRATRRAKNSLVRRETSGPQQVVMIHSPEVEEAKKKLLLALRLTSAELSFVQRKTSEVTSMKPEHEEKTN